MTTAHWYSKHAHLTPAEYQSRRAVHYLSTAFQRSYSAANRSVSGSANRKIKIIFAKSYIQ